MLVSPLLERGWTLEDIKRHSMDELVMINKILERSRVIEQGSGITSEMVKENPELDRIRRRFHDEMELLDERVVETELGQE